MLGDTARTASSPTPRRSATPGRKFWTKTSAPATSRINTSNAAGLFRSRAIDRLLRLLLRNDAVNPARRLPPARVASPPSGASTLITSAPWSARIIVASGPETFDVRSTTRYPCSGPGIWQPLGLAKQPPDQTTPDTERSSLPFLPLPFFFFLTIPLSLFLPNPIGAFRVPRHHAAPEPGSVSDL